MPPQDSDRLIPAKAARKHALFEPVALVLLSLATVGTAWCSFQAAVWGGVSQRTMNLSAVSGRRGAANQLQANQMALLDVLLFSQYINARPVPTKRSRASTLIAFAVKPRKPLRAWMATRPFENSNARAPVCDQPISAAVGGTRRAWRRLRVSACGSKPAKPDAPPAVTCSLPCCWHRPCFAAGPHAKFEALWVRRAGPGAWPGRIRLRRCTCVSASGSTMNRRVRVTQIRTHWSRRSSLPMHERNGVIR